MGEASCRVEYESRLRLTLELMPRDTFRLKFGEIARGTIGGRLVEYSDILSGKKVKLTGIISVMIYKREDCDRVSLVSLFFFFVKRYQ